LIFALTGMLDKSGRNVNAQQGWKIVPGLRCRYISTIRPEPVGRTHHPASHP